MTAVEKFAQLIPLNIQEIFTWYFEQKGVDNPERFLGVNEGAGVNEGVNEGVNGNQPEEGLPVGSEGYAPKINQSEKELQNNVQSSAPISEQPEENNKLPDASALLGLISLLSKLKNKTESKAGDDFMLILGEMLTNMEEK